MGRSRGVASSSGCAFPSLSSPPLLLLTSLSLSPPPLHHRALLLPSLYSPSCLKCVSPPALPFFFFSLRPLAKFYSQTQPERHSRSGRLVCYPSPIPRSFHPMAFSHQPPQAHQSSLGTTRLPSIRDLNFAYDPPPQLPPDPASSPSGPIQQSEHRGAAPNQPQRHDWNRQAPPPSQPTSMPMHRSQHAPVVVNTHDQPRHEPPFGQAGGNLPLSSQMPPPPRDSDSTQKRPRTGAPVGVSPRSSSHVGRVSLLPLLPFFFLPKGNAVLTFAVSHVLL